MNSLITKLLSHISPPSRPLNADGDWNEIEGDLGLTLPEDYKDCNRSPWN